MQLTVDQITRKRLVLVKQLYQRAVAHSRRSQSRLDRILAVIEFDLSIESALKAIIGALDTGKEPDRGFRKLIEQANVLMKSAQLSSVPDEAHIVYIHEVRNKAQHQAIYPNESEVNDCRTYSRDFLAGVVSLVWGMPFEKLTLAEGIEHDEIKQLLVAGVGEFERGEFSRAIDLASEALTRTLGYVESAVVGRLPGFVGGIAVTDSFGGGPGSGERDMLNVIKKMRETLLYQALGMDYAQLIEYRKIVGSTYFTADMKHHRNGGKEVVDRDDAEFVVSYCTDRIMEIEERVGSLARPFGKLWYG